jgi:cyclic pyranopterin phosphate synthase
MTIKRRNATSRKSGRRSNPKPRIPNPGGLSHVDRTGRVRMVDVGAKQHTAREAVARGRITVGPLALREIRAGRVAKGDPLQTARLAGILAAKRTSDLIPLCHPLPISYADVEIKRDKTGYLIESRIGTIAQTGVEMEALTAVAVAALTIYDMLKALDKTMVIGKICVAEKRGGRSGEYRRSSIVHRPSSRSTSRSKA